MKEKIKKIIFITSILYAITIFSLMLYSYNTSNVVFEFTDSKENKELITKYKEELNTVKDSSCKETISDIIKHYENTSYNGNVNVKDYYFSSEGILTYALPLFEACELTEEERQDLSVDYLTAMLQFEEVINDIRWQYEIRIPDSNNRLVVQPLLNSLRYKINREAILDIIDKSINILKESE